MGQLYGWRSGFYLFGSLGVVLAFALVPLLREVRRGESEGKVQAAEDTGIPVRTALGEIFRTRMVLVLVTVFVGANFVAMIFLTWLPSFLFRKFGMSLAMAGFSGAAYFQVASVLGVLCGGMLADRWRMRHPGGRMLTQALGLLIGVPFVFLTGWTLSIPVLILAMAGFGFFKGCYDANIWASLHDVVRPRLRATALGCMNSIGWLGGGLAPVAIAAASQRFGMSACLSASSAIYLVLAFTMLWGVWRFMPRPPAPQLCNAVSAFARQTTPAWQSRNTDSHEETR
jgi:predicted MFS family arabinose efflux permease